MWFLRKILWLCVFPFFALWGILMFAFPEEIKEFKKDIVDMFDNEWIRWTGFFLFLFSMVHIIKIFDGKHTLVRLTDPNYK